MTVLYSDFCDILTITIHHILDSVLYSITAQ
uniref:Uncharacterized protein n=1 Tax=Arundo donax TaxID=35708 RepID=A0A0A9G8U0_ARUDO